MLSTDEAERYSLCIQGVNEESSFEAEMLGSFEIFGVRCFRPLWV